MQLYRVTYTDKNGFVTNEWFTGPIPAQDRVNEAVRNDELPAHFQIVHLPVNAPGALAMCKWLNENSNTPPGSQKYVSVPDTHPHAEVLKQPLVWPEMGEPVAVAGRGEPEPGIPRMLEEAAQARIDREVAGSKPTNPKDAIGIRKAPLSVVPMDVIVEVGVGMLEGTAKYGRHNYRCAGVRASVYFDATMRHLISWWEGEDIDPDSGLSHITKAICSLVVWRAAQLQNRHTDDRPPRATPFYEQANAKAAAILDKHADKNPRHYTIEDTGLTV